MTTRFIDANATDTIEQCGRNTASTVTNDFRLIWDDTATALEIINAIEKVKLRLLNDQVA